MRAVMGQQGLDRVPGRLHWDDGPVVSAITPRAFGDLATPLLLCGEGAGLFVKAEAPQVVIPHGAVRVIIERLPEEGADVLQPRAIAEDVVPFRDRHNVQGVEWDLDLAVLLKANQSGA